MRALLVAAVVAAAALIAAPAFADVHVTIHDGRVTVVARDATVRQILEEWARVGQMRLLNADRIGGGPITIELSDMPEAQALDVLLRAVSGYVAAPRAQAAASASVFDRIIVMPASTPPAGGSAQPPRAALPTPPAFPSPAPPMAGSPLGVPGGEVGEENDAIRPPTFSPFPPQGAPAQQVAPPQGPLALPQPGGAPAGTAGAAYPGAPTGAPGSVSVPGMVAPTPQPPGQMPGAPQQPVPVRR